MSQLIKNQLLDKPKDILETPLQHFYGVCERTSMDNIFAEPLNVLSSFLFFITAFVIFRECKQNKEISSKWIIDIYVLTGLIFFIGIGSSVFHMVPNYYTELMDIIFIIAFINLFFLSVLKRIAYLKWFQVVVAFLAFLGTTNFIVSKFPHALNDSIGYLSSMLALCFVAVYLKIRRRPSAKYYAYAALIGVISLTFRVIDNKVCNHLSIGTHFLWHSLNALLIYIIMKMLIRSVNRRARMLKMAAEYGL